MMGRLRQKACTICEKFEAVLYRIQYDESHHWVFACRCCWEKVSQNNPNYVYGGTWKAKK